MAMISPFVICNDSMEKRHVHTHEERLWTSKIYMEIEGFLVDYCESLQVKKFIPTFLSSEEIQSLFSEWSLNPLKV